MKLRIRKLQTISSNNVWWVLFEEGNIDKPICLLDEYDAGQLLKDMVDECEKEKSNDTRTKDKN